MIIKSIELANFRNYEKFKLGFSRRATLLVGENGSGKTSVIEGIYLAVVGKSFRGGDGEMMRRGAEFYRVEVECSGRMRVVKYDGKRTFLVSGKKYGRLPGAEKYPVVLFLPSDLNLVGSSPRRKRDYFDGLLSQLDDNYHRALLKYNRALKQRNEILKEGRGLGAAEVFPWNVMLAKYGVEMESQRGELQERVNRLLGERYREIARKEDDCRLEVSGLVGISEGGYLRKLDDGLERDKVIGHTGFGVHRDEWRFDFNGRPAEATASRGETRSMILALKFIEAELLEERLKKKPVILLDDVFSELDEERQRNLVRNFARNQIIMTAVREPEVEGFKLSGLSTQVGG